MGTRQITAWMRDGDRLEWVALAARGDARRRTGGDLVRLEAAAAEGAPAAAALAPVLAAAPRGEAILVVPSRDILTRVVALPAVDDEELAGMAALQADQMSPFPVDDAVVTHEELARRDGQRVVLLAVGRLAAIEAYVAPFVEAGLKVRRVDVSIMARWRVLTDAGHPAGDDRRVLMVQDGRTVETIVVERGVPLLMRSFEVAAAAEPAALARELAEEWRQTLLAVELQAGPARTALDAWVADGAQIPDLAAELARGLDVPVQLHPAAELASVCEGAARRAGDAGRLDLMPPARLEAAAARRRRLGTIAALAGIVGLWALTVAALTGLFAIQERRLAALRRQANAWAAPAMEVRDIRRRVLALERYTDSTYSSLECLREISLKLPDGVDLTSYTFSKEAGVRLAGRAPEPSFIYAFKEALDRSTLFTEAVLGDQNEDRRLGLWSFEMVLTIPETQP